MKSALPWDSNSSWASEYHLGRSDALFRLLPQDHNAALVAPLGNVFSHLRATHVGLQLLGRSVRQVLIYVLYVLVIMEVGRTASTVSKLHQIPHSSRQSGIFGQFVCVPQYTINLEIR